MPESINRSMGVVTSHSEVMGNVKQNNECT